ncbi:hypothetical protein BDL97_16G036200 [Sphagnum fallax]|nr:hypothetical protein BDL97_16G036200 [Sphagnum fallax]
METKNVGGGGGGGVVLACDIPVEYVDDEEMAAIEAAYLQIPLSVAAGYSFELQTKKRGGGGESCDSRVLQCSSKRQLVSDDGLDDHHHHHRKSASVWIRDTTEEEEKSSLLCIDKRSLSTAKECIIPCPVEANNSSPADGQDQEQVGGTLDGNSRNVEEGAHHASSEAITFSSPTAGSEGCSQEPSQSSRGVTIGDIEDVAVSRQANGDGEAKPHRPHHRSLCVTDLTALEWCEKQVEFSLTRGKPQKTEAMKAGSARHVELEIEVVTRVEVQVLSKEDSWAIRLLNFITGARQLQSEGLTRELPVLGVVQGCWIVGIIDELQLCGRDGVERPLLIDTKTRNRPTPPSEPQKRNGRCKLCKI